MFQPMCVGRSCHLKPSAIIWPMGQTISPLTAAR